MDLEKDRNPQINHLHKNERKLLAGEPYKNDLDSEVMNRAHRNIRDKRLPNLPQRIQALVDDIALLDVGGYLDSEHWSEGWDKIVQIDSRERLKRQSKFIDPHPWTPNTQIKDEVRIGYTIGQMMRSLTSLADTDINYNRLGWGFILGIFGENRSNFNRENRKVSEFIQYINKKQSEKKDRASDIEEIVDINDIEKGFADYYTLTGKSDIEKKIDEMINSIQEYKHSTERKERKEIDYLNHIENVFDFSGEELSYAHELISQINRTIDLINNSQSGGLSAKEVLREIWTSENNQIDRDTIRKNCNTSKKQVTELMNNFGNKPSSAKWEEVASLVRVEGKTRVNKKWSLTSYGYMICYALFKEDGFKLIRRAVGQIITKQHSQYDLHEEIDNHIEKEFLE